MDHHEKVKEAKSIKEEGNDYFKRGKLPEAQKSYTKVLDMLREEITFTGDDQKKERESLILAAHLNLAQCALQLGDYGKVIDHCNTALGLDSNNVKAHFRRAKAFENLSEYAKALEGYQTVIGLEPHNRTAQEQKSECQKKLNSEKGDGQLSNMIKQKPGDTEDDDMEIVYENCEDVLNSRYRDCTKNPGHKAFINVKDFQINHLPSQYQDEDLYEHLRDLIQITVLLKVKGNSEHRPEFAPGTTDRYPASGKKYRRLIRYGSGWVFGLMELPGLCPCAACQSSREPIKQWAQIFIQTARHVVYDDIEGSKTVCYFFYDAEGDDYQTCPSVCNAVSTDSFHEDQSVLSFISHDQNLIAHLRKMRQNYIFSQMNIKCKYNVSAFFDKRKDMLDNLIQLQHRLSKLSTEFCQQLDTARAIYNEEPPTEYLKHLAEQAGIDKDEVEKTGNIKKEKLGEGQNYEYFIERISEGIDMSCRYHTSVGEAVESYQDLAKTDQGKQRLESVFRKFVAMTKILEKQEFFLRLQILSCIKSITVSVPEGEVEDYNKAHPLVVIVSHPHGCSKKISIGEVINIASKDSRRLCQFTYSTATCPGSSGAPVFILGDIANFDVRPHSCFGGNDSDTIGQRNESAMTFNSEKLVFASKR